MSNALNAYLQEFHCHFSQCFYSQFETQHFATLCSFKEIGCTGFELKRVHKKYFEPDVTIMSLGDPVSKTSSFVVWLSVYRSGEGCCLLEVELILKQQDTHSEYETLLSQTPILSLSLERTDPLQGEAGSVECKQLTDSPTKLSRLQLTRDRVYSITSIN